MLCYVCMRVCMCVCVCVCLLCSFDVCSWKVSGHTCMHHTRVRGRHVLSVFVVVLDLAGGR